MTLEAHNNCNTMTRKTVTKIQMLINRGPSLAQPNYNNCILY